MYPVTQMRSLAFYQMGPQTLGSLRCASLFSLPPSSISASPGGTSPWFYLG